MARTRSVSYDRARMRYLGVDLGQARVGLALSDDEGVIAHPRGHVLGRGTPEDVAARVRDAVVGETLGAVVVGLPLRLDGSEGLPARRARVMGRAIAAALGVRVVFRDERLTTVQVERSLGELGVRGKDRRAVVDAAAAALLLQSYLEERSHRAWKASDGEAVRGAEGRSDAPRGTTRRKPGGPPESR